ncbi:hypothetical protein [Sporosarcina sp. YIM B06819]|uniref:hypothetical protein n=1 Tax=Sporosarcina sp. YIM B06819 TaxID=3081769 RepID=UPI00298CC86A|nr:hypothetical protein [Sporosarcina sp. YIM B06819]
MKKNKSTYKVITSFLIALGIFINLAGHTDTTITEPTKIVIDINGEPIGGKH